MENIETFHLPRWDQLPNIDLYMDQILTYIEDSLGRYIILDENEKLITKTMINNYVKQDVIKPPINKKYNKLHLAELFVICILKEIYSINDIKKLIELALKTSTPENVYNKFCNVFEKTLTSTFKKNYKRNKEKETSQEEYLLKNVVQSYVNKLYVQLVYLKKESD